MVTMATEVGNYTSYILSCLFDKYFHVFNLVVLWRFYIMDVNGDTFFFLCVVVVVVDYSQLVSSKEGLTL
jgi:hypothetical protein